MLPTAQMLDGRMNERTSELKPELNGSSKGSQGGKRPPDGGTQRYRQWRG